MALKFRYDPTGNRIEKRFYNLDGTNNIIRTRATHYVRDASGNQMAVYEFSDNDTLMLKEFDIYGSSRVGLVHENDIILGTGIVSDSVTDAWLISLGDKEYEQTSHGSTSLTTSLGNVMSTISDKPVAVDTTTDGLTDFYNPVFVTAQDYYPFGMLMPGRQFSLSNYRFGFNSVEKVDEVSGVGNHYEFKFREYDPRIGRFWSVDPLFKD